MANTQRGTTSNYMQALWSLDYLLSHIFAHGVVVVDVLLCSAFLARVTCCAIMNREVNYVYCVKMSASKRESSQILN
jgi:hypothetical protein